MGSSISCSSIQTIDTSIEEPAGVSQAVLAVKTTTRCGQSPDVVHQDVRPENEAIEQQAMNESNCSWCQSEFKRTCDHEDGSEISSPCSGGDSIDGASLVMDKERSPSSNNYFCPSGLSENVSLETSAVRKVEDICKSSELQSNEAGSFSGIPECIDRRSVSRNLPQVSEEEEELLIEESGETIGVTTTALESPDILDPEYDSVANSLHSLSDAISARNEEDVSLHESSLLVNLRTESICTGCGSECGDEDFSLPDDEYQVVSEVELSKYEVLAGKRRANSGLDPLTLLPFDAQHPILASLKQQSNWNQLDNETVILMDLLERLSHILVIKVKQQIRQKDATGSQQPLQRLTASGAIVRRVQHRKRAIIVQDGRNQYKIHGESTGSVNSCSCYEEKSISRCVCLCSPAASARNPRVPPAAPFALFSRLIGRRRTCDCSIDLRALVCVKLPEDTPLL